MVNYLQSISSAGRCGQAILIFKRSFAGRGLSTVEHCLSIETGSFFKCVFASSEKMLRAVKDEKILNQVQTKQGGKNGKAANRV